MKVEELGAIGSLSVVALLLSVAFIMHMCQC